MRKLGILLVIILLNVLIGTNVSWLIVKSEWQAEKATLTDKLETFHNNLVDCEEKFNALDVEFADFRFEKEYEINVLKEDFNALSTEFADFRTEKDAELQKEMAAKEELSSQNLKLQESLEVLEQQREWWRGVGYDAIMTSIEDELVLTAAVRESSVEVRPVVFYPKDGFGIITAEQKEKIERSLRIVQQYFLLKVGETFIFSETVVVQGQRLGSEYDGLSYELAAEVILNELPPLQAKTYYLVFAPEWSSRSFKNYAYFFKGAVLEGWSSLDIFDGNSTWRYRAMGLITHELGHVFAGLPDVATEEPEMMGYSPENFFWAYNFPSVDFSPAHINRLKNHMQ